MQRSALIVFADILKKTYGQLNRLNWQFVTYMLITQASLLQTV